jgi:L-ribulose-5-phosphate 3-epimerase UlaE
MKIGINSGTYPKSMAFEEMIRVSGELGYDSVEFNVDERVLLPRMWGKQKRAELLALAEDCGVALQSLCINAHSSFNYASPDPHTRAMGVSLLNECMELAVDLKGELILVCGWDSKEPKVERSWDLFKAGLLQSVSLAEHHGITLAIEAVGYHYLLTTAQLMDMITEINSPCLGVYLDVGNAASIGLSPVEEIRAAGDRAAQMHFKDTQAKFFAQTLPFGEGIVDFRAALRALEDIGYDGYLVVELHPAPDDPVRIAREAKAYMDTLLAEAG